MAARLEYEITGSVSGLAAAASQATGILNNLQNTANQLNIKLFSAETVGDINGIGGALTIVNNKIKEYLDTAIKSSSAFKEAQQQTALDNLANKLQVLTGNVDIFGQSVKNSQAQITAYQTAISGLLSSGLSPFDDKVTALKAKIDALTASIEQQKAAAAPLPPPVDARTLGLIEAATARLEEFRQAKRQALTTNEINAFNQQINQTEQELRDLQNIGNRVNQTVGTTGRSAVNAGAGINSFNLELGRIVQDAPFAANNFGAIGNNITRAFEVLPQYRDRLREVIVAQGGTATSGAVLRQGIASLFTGFSGLSLALSLVISGFTIYQQQQQAAARKAQEHTNVIQKQKQALDDYIGTLSAAQRVEAAAASNYDKEIVKLDSLYNSLKNNTSARLGNKYALEELIRTWPSEFSNLLKGGDYVDNLTSAYKRLRTEIQATGALVAANKLSADTEVDLVKNTVARADAQNNLNRAQKAYNDELATISSLKIDTTQRTPAQLAFLAGNLKNAQDAFDEYNQAVFKNEVTLRKFADAAKKAQETINSNSVAKGRIQSLQDYIDLYTKLKVAETDESKIFEYNAKIKVAQAELDRLNEKDKVSALKTLQRELSIRQQIANILSKGLNAANTSGLSDYGAEVQKVTALYADLNRQLDQVAQKLAIQEKLFDKTSGKQGISPKAAATDRSAIATGKNALGLEQQKQLNDARIAEEKRVATEVQRINDEYGVKAQESRNRELAAVDARANSEIATAKSKTRSLIAITNDYIARLQQAGNSPTAIAAATAVFDAEVQEAKDSNTQILAIQNGRVVAKGAIDEKYLVNERQLQDSIVGLNDSALAELNDKQGQRTDKIVAEWEKRKVAASKYFDELRKIAPKRADQFNAQQTQLNNLFDTVKFKQVSEELSKNFATAMQQGVNAFAQNFYTAITTLGEQRSAIDLKYNLQLEQASDDTTKAQINNLRQIELAATTSFGAIFSSLTQSLFQTFNKSIFDSFTKRLTENLGNTLIGPSQDQLASQATAALIQNAGISFAASVTAAGTTLAASLGIASAGTVTASATASKNITTAGTQLSKGVATALAGLSVAGGLVSGLTPKTSSVGQGIGGALSGAGTGALLGSALGPGGALAGGIIGGIAGAIGGLFGASKAKKQEELQRQQLEEQKKQSAYLQSLAYTATIVGRVTAEGTVTGVTIDAFGKLVAQISGKDLQFVLDRNAKTRI